MAKKAGRMGEEIRRLEISCGGLQLHSSSVACDGFPKFLLGDRLNYLFPWVVSL